MSLATAIAAFGPCFSEGNCRSRRPVASLGLRIFQLTSLKVAHSATFDPVTTGAGWGHPVKVKGAQLGIVGGAHRMQPRIPSMEDKMGTEPGKGARAARNTPLLESGSNRNDGARLSGPALRAFFAIAEKWGLTSREERILLGYPPRSTFFRWKLIRRGRLGSDALDRISYLLGIYRALHEFLPEPDQADGWVRRPNAFFNGRSALQRMLGGGMTDLRAVRELLDSRFG